VGTHPVVLYDFDVIRHNKNLEIRYLIELIAARLSARRKLDLHSSESGVATPPQSKLGTLNGDRFPSDWICEIAAQRNKSFLT
jgi:hypothetical protein